MRFGRAAGAAAIGYLVGTFPTADLVAKRVSGGQIDLRTTGSGNPGGANAVQVLGKKAGYTVIAVDIAKGAAASAIGASVAGPTGAHAAGSASVIGHCLPVWNGFKGGKGVGASIGQCLVTFPAYFPVDLGVAAITAAVPRWKQRAFMTTMVSSVCWVLGGMVWWRKGWRNLWGPTPGPGLPIAAAVSSCMITYKFLTAKPPSTTGTQALNSAQA